MDKSLYTKEHEAVIELLKSLREAKSLTQSQLAELLGQSQSFVSKYERGDRRLDVVQLRTICRFLGSSLPAFAQQLESVLATTTKKTRRR